MLLEALSSLVLASAPQAQAQAQAPPATPAGRPFADLLLALRGHCPLIEPRVRSAGPDELMRLETGFRDQLAAQNRTKLEQARRGGGARCGDGGGASCQASAELSAILDSDLMGAFALYVCGRETAAGPR